MHLAQSTCAKMQGEMGLGGSVRKVGDKGLWLKNKMLFRKINTPSLFQGGYL